MSHISMGRDYENRMFGTVGGRYVSIVEIRAIFEYLKPQKDDIVLDVGTGTGRIARSLARYVKDLVGLDRDRTVLERALIEAKREGAGNYYIIVGCAEHLPFREKYFRKVVCVRSFKYFKDYMKSLREMGYTLEDGGHLILEVSNILSWAVISRLPNMLSNGYLGYPKLFVLRDLLSKISSNGFAIVDRLALHKMEPMLLSRFNNRYLTRILVTLDSILQRITPFELFSRGVLLRCLKVG